MVVAGKRSVRPFVFRLSALAALLSVASLASVVAVAGCSSSSRSAASCGASCGLDDGGLDATPPNDAGLDTSPIDAAEEPVGDAGCPANPPTLQSSCSVSPLAMCTYGTPCQGGIVYYCSGFHWFAETQVCNTNPPCPTTIPSPGDSCSGFNEATQCPYGTMCADAGEAIATCVEDEWALVGADCTLPLGERSSLLCGGMAAVCDPDMVSFADAGSACHTAPDGGSGAGACRVAAGSDGGGAPACAVAGAGHDGSPCASSASCGAGFECVAAPGGGGVCRKYCCDNTCPGAGDPSNPPPEVDGGAALPFCDIEPTLGNPQVSVPVCVQQATTCVPFEPCTDPSQTCAVVDLVGTTACITAGSQQAGESCETAHCASGLTCVGVFPQRTCMALCDYGNDSCGGQCDYDFFLSSASPGLGVCSQ